jgi:GAF domain-containing protein
MVEVERDPVRDPQRLAAVKNSGLLDTPGEEPFDRLARLAASVLDTPYAFITVVDEERSFWKACIGVDALDVAQRQNRLEESFCQYVVGSGEPLVVSDTRVDDVTRDNPSIASMGVLAWAGYPLRSPDGQVLGTFCAVDTATRTWDRYDLEVLETLAAAASSEVALRAAVDSEREARERADAAAEELGYRATLLRSATENTPEGICVLSPSGELASINTRFRDLFGLPEPLPAAGAGDAVQGFLDRLLPDSTDATELCLPADAEPLRDEVELVDGRILERFAAPLVGSDGTHHGTAWYVRDVTTERRSARELVESGERFAALARTLQESLLPPSLPDVPGLEVAARYLPAGAGESVVGDFYDVFQAGRSSWGVVMGDVCGKGVEAAKVTALARYTIRAAAMRTSKPSEVLATLNEAMLAQSDSDERFLTAVYATLRPTRGAVMARLCSGGHAPALVRRADGRVKPVGRPGTILGVLPEPDLTDVGLGLRPGDLLLLYTDGVTEARNADGELFGEERLIALLRGADGRDAVGVATAVEDAVTQFAGVAPTDDTAVLVLRVRS